MKKTYLKVEYGSRGEMEIIGLVETNVLELQKELNDIIEGCEDEDELEYYQEFMNLDEVEDRGVIEVCISEEESYTYIDYEKNKEIVDEILEITELCNEGKMEWEDGDVRVNDLLFSVVE